MENRGFYKKNENNATLLLVGLVVLHFIFTVIYVTPDHYFPRPVKDITSAYMLPAFHQGWNLFAPDPPIQEKSMLFKIKGGGEWSEWLDPGKDLLEQHDRFRLSNANIAFRIHQNAAYRLWEEHYRAEELAEIRGADFQTEQYVRNSRGYRTAKYYAFQFYQREHSGSTADSIQLKLVIGSPPDLYAEGADWRFETINFEKDGKD